MGNYGINKLNLPFIRIHAGLNPPCIVVECRVASDLAGEHLLFDSLGPSFSRNLITSRAWVLCMSSIRGVRLLGNILGTSCGKSLSQKSTFHTSAANVPAMHRGGRQNKKVRSMSLKVRSMSLPSKNMTFYFWNMSQVNSIASETDILQERA